MMLSKAKEKKCVFKGDFKTVRLGASLTWRGSSFHSLGATAEKARSPLLLSRVKKC